MCQEKTNCKECKCEDLTNVPKIKLHVVDGKLLDQHGNEYQLSRVSVAPILEKHFNGEEKNTT